MIIQSLFCNFSNFVIKLVYITLVIDYLEIKKTIVYKYLQCNNIHPPPFFCVFKKIGVLKKVQVKTKSNTIDTKNYNKSRMTNDMAYRIV